VKDNTTVKFRPFRFIWLTTIMFISMYYFGLGILIPYFLINLDIKLEDHSI